MGFFCLNIFFLVVGCFVIFVFGKESEKGVGVGEVFSAIVFDVFDLCVFWKARGGMVGKDSC